MKKNFKDTVIDFVLFITAIILLNLVSVNAYKTFDITGQDTYSLSAASKKAVENIEEPLTISVYFTKDLPSPYNEVYQYLEDILKEYKVNANKNFSYKFFNMDKEENVQLAYEQGLNLIQIQDIKTNEVGFKQVWMGLVISYEDRNEVIDGISTTKLLEYKITTTINKMISTVSILSGLKENIKMTLYCSDSLKDAALNINGMNKLESTVRSAYEDVNRKNKGKVDFVTAAPGSDESIELQKKYGIQLFNTARSSDKPESASFGLVLEYDGKFKVVPVGIQRSFFGYGVAGIESVDALSANVTESLKSLVSKTSEIGYTIGHSEAYLDDTQTGGAYITVATADKYKFKELDLSSEEIPSGLTSLMINGAKDSFSEEELYKIDQFLMKGGNVIIFADAFFEQLPTQQNYYYSQPSYVPVNTGLEKILSKYGVELGKDYVMDESCLTLYDQNNKPTPLSFMPLLTTESFSKKSVITKGLGEIFFAQHSSIDITEAQKNKELKVTPLVKTSENSWLLKDNITTYPAFIAAPRDAEGNTDKSSFKSENIAVLLEGKFTSAFEKNPAVVAGDDSIAVDGHLSKSIQNGKLIVVSSSKITGSFLYTLSTFLQKNYSLLDEQSFGPAGVIFVQNILDYMNGDEDMCAMRNKSLLYSNTFIIDNDSAKDTWAKILKYFFMFGLPVLVAVAGLIVLMKLQNKKAAIKNKYNKDDSRYIDKE